MSHRLFLPCWLCIIIVLFFSSSSPHLVQKSKAQEQGTVKIVISSLNVRDNPGLKYPIIGQVHKDESYPIADTKDNWVQITLESGEKGWVASWLIEFEQPMSASSTTYITSTIDGLNVRSGPSTSFQAIDQINQGEQYVQLDTEGDWVKIRLRSGQEGWTANWLIKEATAKVPAMHSPPKNIAIAAIPLLNVRSGPDTSTSLVGQLEQGTSAEIVDRKGDWIQIRTKTLNGWVANWLVQEKEIENPNAYIKILNPGTNIRSGPKTSMNVIHIANEGDTFPVLSQEGDWFKIRLNNQKVGYVAGWIVSANGIPNVERKGIENILKGKTIIIDPGHGGNDSGAIGPHLGSLEKVINLDVSRLLGSKLKAAGATVYYTRLDDRKVSLQDRVYMAVNKQVDAFISIHHNTSNNFQVNGVMTYFYSDGEDRKLAGIIQKELVKRTRLTDLKARYGDYFVLRENPQLAVLCELGFLTNYQEEVILNTNNYQDQAAEGIFQGILKYFKEEKK